MYKLFVIIFFVLLSCSEIVERSKYREMASELASKKNCDPNIELLLTHEKTELWASYHNKDKKLLCVLTCVNDVCMFSTERD
tara:strand:- start:1497 stop:1742 length:246 start_codon:yes stop_codon:yes gene_type:complete